MGVAEFIRKQLENRAERRKAAAYAYQRGLPDLGEKRIESARVKRVRKGAIRLLTWAGLRRTTRGASKRVRNG
jgi:hypothetical protein